MDPVEANERVVLFVRGNVQGVGFRWWTRSQALQRDLIGYARNTCDGRVEVCAQGARSDVLALAEALDPKAAIEGRPGAVSGVSIQWRPPRADLRGFVER